MKKRGIRVWLLLVAGLAGLLGGCMSESRKIISYMEERYGKTFTYEGETNGMLGSRAFTAKLSCPDYPGMTILASLVQRDGEESYSDNYLAVSYHEDAEQKICEAAGRVLEHYQLFLDKPDLTMKIDNPEAYSLEDYLADPNAFKTVWIMTYDEVNEEVFQALVQTFCDENITVNGVLAVPSDSSDTVEMTKEEFENFLANQGRVKTQVNFKVQDGELVREDWRRE